MGYIIAASASPIISVVTQSALFERNICNGKWADSSPVSDGGYHIFYSVLFEAKSHYYNMS